jgi:hypothetical protein
MSRTDFANRAHAYYHVQPRVSDNARNNTGDISIHRLNPQDFTHVQDSSVSDASYFDEVSPIGPAPPTNPKKSSTLPGPDIDVQRQLVELIHVLRRIALARRVALESTANTKVAHRASVDRAGCSTQQVIDLLLLAKSMAAQAMKISVAKPCLDGSSENVKQQDLPELQRSDRSFRNYRS